MLMCFCLALLFPTTLDPVHNSLEDSPCDVQNRQAEQHVLQHARIPFPSIQVKPAMNVFKVASMGHWSPMFEDSLRRGTRDCNGAFCTSAYSSGFPLYSPERPCRCFRLVCGSFRDVLPAQRGAVVAPKQLRTCSGTISEGEAGVGTGGSRNSRYYRFQFRPAPKSKACPKKGSHCPPFSKMSGNRDGLIRI